MPAGRCAPPSGPPPPRKRQEAKLKSSPRVKSAGFFCGPAAEAGDRAGCVAWRPRPRGRAAAALREEGRCILRRGARRTVFPALRKWPRESHKVARGRRLSDNGGRVRMGGKKDVPDALAEALAARMLYFKLAARAGPARSPLSTFGAYPPSSARNARPRHDDAFASDANFVAVSACSSSGPALPRLARAAAS